LMRVEFHQSNAIDDDDYSTSFSESGRRSSSTTVAMATTTTPTTTTEESVTTDPVTLETNTETMATEVYTGGRTEVPLAEGVEKRHGDMTANSSSENSSSEKNISGEERRGDQPPLVTMATTQTTTLRAVNACPVREEVISPYWANNTRGEILALLNLYPFEQYVHWEKCNQEHRQMYCRQGCRCEQQYRLHRLLAFDPANECRGIFSDWFRFPSCCVCKCYLTEEEISTHLERNDQFFVDSNNRSPRNFNFHDNQQNSFHDDQDDNDFDDDDADFSDPPDVRGVDGHFYYRENNNFYPR